MIHAFFTSPCGTYEEPLMMSFDSKKSMEDFLKGKPWLRVCGVIEGGSLITYPFDAHKESE